MQLLFLGLTALYATCMITVSFEQQDPLTDIIEDKERIVSPVPVEMFATIVLMNLVLLSYKIRTSTVSRTAHHVN